MLTWRQCLFSVLPTLALFPCPSSTRKRCAAGEGLKGGKGYFLRKILIVTVLKRSWNTACTVQCKPKGNLHRGKEREEGVAIPRGCARPWCWFQTPPDTVHCTLNWNLEIKGYRPRSGGQHRKHICSFHSLQLSIWRWIILSYLC